MKKSSTVLLREYVAQLSVGELQSVNQRLSHKLCGDYAEVARILSQDKEIDQWLRSANSADEWFNLLDIIEAAIGKELKRREQQEVAA